LLHRLKQQDYDKVLSLFAPLAEFKSAVSGVLDGTQLGTVFVDDTANPQSACMYWDQLLILAGNPDNVAFNHALHTLVMKQGFADASYQTVSDGIVTLCHPAAWQDRFDVVFGARMPVEEARGHYVFRQSMFDWREMLPDEGISVQSINKALLDNDSLENIQELRASVQGAWAESAANFEEQGVGACVLTSGEIVGWCYTRMVARDDACELTLETVDTYIGQGVATLASAAAIDFCLARGFVTIEEHIADWNTPSLRVAEKVGFVRERDYSVYTYFFDAAIHFSVAGEINLKFGRFQEALHWYKKSFDEGEAPLPSYYNAAVAAVRIEDSILAFKYLNMAIDMGRGFISLDLVKNAEVFDDLHDTPEWAAVLERIQRENDDYS
jgi:RimJ/RimL family protein N-acetyltransferase